MASKLFFGFAVPIGVQAHALDMIDTAKHLALSAEWITADKLHVTVLFVGEAPAGEDDQRWLDRSRIAGRALSKHAPSFDATVSHPALFSSPTLYLRVKVPDAFLPERGQLARDALGPDRVSRGAWMPHLTLAKGGPRADLNQACKLLYPRSQDITFPVSSISLYKTETGKPYAEVEKYYLGPKVESGAEEAF